MNFFFGGSRDYTPLNLTPVQRRQGATFKGVPVVYDDPDPVGTLYYYMETHPGKWVEVRELPKL